MTTKEPLAKGMEKVGMIKNKCQALEEDRAEIMLHPAETEGKYMKDPPRQTSAHKAVIKNPKASRQEKKRDAPSPPLENSRRDKREKTKDDKVPEPSNEIGVDCS